MKFRSDWREKRNLSSHSLSLHELDLSHLTYPNQARKIRLDFASEEAVPTEGVRKCDSPGRLAQNTKAPNVQGALLSLVWRCPSHFDALLEQEEVVRKRVST